LCTLKRKMNVKKKAFLAKQLSFLKKNIFWNIKTLVVLQFHVLLESIKLKNFTWSWS
jgi:hypothetical protein